jgi:hypothetical protein
MGPVLGRRELAPIPFRLLQPRLHCPGITRLSPAWTWVCGVCWQISGRMELHKICGGYLSTSVTSLVTITSLWSPPLQRFEIKSGTIYQHCLKSWSFLLRKQNRICVHCLINNIVIHALDQFCCPVKYSGSRPCIDSDIRVQKYDISKLAYPTVGATVKK